MQQLLFTPFILVYIPYTIGSSDGQVNIKIRRDVWQGIGCAGWWPQSLEERGEGEGEALGDGTEKNIVDGREGYRDCGRRHPC